METSRNIIAADLTHLMQPTKKHTLFDFGNTWKNIEVIGVGEINVLEASISIYPLSAFFEVCLYFFLLKTNQ